MASGDAQRTWFPEMIAMLHQTWSASTQLPHSTPCCGFMKAHKCLVFKGEVRKAYIVTNTISFSLDFLMK